MIRELHINTTEATELLEVTAEVQRTIEAAGVKNGLVLLFVPHTTAAITINENADPDVASDLLKGLNQLVPQHNHYLHREGNSAAHIKCSLVGASEQIIIHQGKLQLGTWQGIYFCEFDGPRPRTLQLKLIES